MDVAQSIVAIACDSIVNFFCSCHL